MDFSIFYREGPKLEDEIESAGEWDIFLSAYNESDRVQRTFDRVNSESKLWFLQHEYNIDESTWPDPTFQTFHSHKGQTESDSIPLLVDYIKDLLNVSIDELREKRICIDVTGFIRPNLLFLLLYLHRAVQIKKFSLIYSEPETYKKGENTEFSQGASLETRMVNGFSPGTSGSISNDLLIAGTGFENKLLSELLDFKSHAKKMLILGFPSLQPDMYQQARLKTHGLEIAKAEERPYFAPANDPFATADILKSLVEEQSHKSKITNLYLSPLGTKPQVIGFCLYYIYAFIESDSPFTGGMLFPFKEYYSKETSEGLSKLWIYTIEFPLLGV